MCRVAELTRVFLIFNVCVRALKSFNVVFVNKTNMVFTSLSLFDFRNVVSTELYVENLVKCVLMEFANNENGYNSFLVKINVLKTTQCTKFDQRGSKQ